MNAGAGELGRVRRKVTGGRVVGVGEEERRRGGEGREGGRR